jgi:hypothetical protein
VKANEVSLMIALEASLSSSAPYEGQSFLTCLCEGSSSGLKPHWKTVSDGPFLFSGLLLCPVPISCNKITR